MDATEGRIQGALTQGLGLLRQQADDSPFSFSPPESLTLFSQSDLYSQSDGQDDLFKTADDQSDFDVGIADQVVSAYSSADINEIPATPALPLPSLMSVRDTPIQSRLRGNFFRSYHMRLFLPTRRTKGYNSMLGLSFTRSHARAFPVTERPFIRRSLAADALIHPRSISLRPSPLRFRPELLLVHMS